MTTRMLGWAMVPMIATLAGCGEPARDQAVTGGNQAIAESGAAAQVAQLTPEQRNGVFEKAIRDSGVACPAVTGSERTEIRPGVKGWKAQCDNDSAHLIEITPDGLRLLERAPGVSVDEIRDATEPELHADENIPEIAV